MAVFDDVQQWWSRLAERERRLISLSGVVGIICVFGFVGFLIRDGLRDIETSNQEVRNALRLLVTERDRYFEELNQSDTDVIAKIGLESQPLLTYIEPIAKELGVPIPESNERTGAVKGKFLEKTIDITLRGVSIEQLAQLLKQIESRSPIVVTQKLHIKTYFNQHEKLDVQLTVATYQRAPKKKMGGKNKKG